MTNDPRPKPDTAPEPRYSGKDDPWPPPGEQGPQADADSTASGYRREHEPEDTP
jgi:hypothetical protein